MKRLVVVLLCAVLLHGVVPSVSAAEAEPCKPTEAESQIMYDSVFRLAEAGVVRLRIDWVDGVDSPVTRASFASMVVRVMGQPDPEVFAAVRPFADVEGHWAAGAVAAVLAEGIVTGDPGGRFRPDDYITLNEAKLMLARMLRLGPDLTLSSADKALRRGGVDTTLPCAPAQRITYLQAYTLLDRVLSVPYYARFQWQERRIRREFAAGLVYESEDGTRIEAPSWAQIEARLGSGHELMDVEAVLTTADGSYIKAWGGPQAYHVEVGLYTADGGLRRFRANGSQVPERGYTTIDGTTVYLLAGNRMPNYVVPSLFRSFMEEEFPPKGIRWVEVSTLNDKVTANAPFCIMSPAEVDLAQKAVDRLAAARAIREAYTINPASAEVTMSRAEFAAILRRGLGLSEQSPPGQPPFADMDSHWASSEVALLVQEGIVTGNPDGRFRPDDPVTLNEVKLMLARAFRLGADLRLESADEALRSGGIDTAVPCGEMPHATQYQALILLDRVMGDERQSMP